MLGTARTHGPTPSSGPGRASSWAARGRTRVRAAARPLVVGAAGAAAVLVVATLDPHRPGSYGVCPMFALTGLSCAGCGGLRATYDLAHGDLAAAWDMNPVWVLFVPVLLAAWVAWLARRWTATPAVGPALASGDGDPATGAAPRPDVDSGFRRALPWAVLALVVLYSTARNVPALAPWLAP